MGRLKRTGRYMERKTPSARKSSLVISASKPILQLYICLFLLILPVLAFAHVTQAATGGSAGLHPSSAVWKIHQEGKFRATAFAIGTNRFITNAHVIKAFVYRGSGEIQLVQQGSDVKLRFDKLLAVSMTYDLALFETKESARDYLTVAESFSWEQADDLYALGYPWGSFLRANQIGEIIYNDGLAYGIPMDKVIRVGMSGGPVIRDGKVVAVMARVNENIAYPVTLENLKGFIGDRLGQPQLGVSCSQLSVRRCLERGIEETRRLATQEGDRVAQYQLGRGQGYINKRVSVELLEISARQGLPRASSELGFIYYENSRGMGAAVADELQKIAVDWHKRAAAAGELRSQTELYFLYFHGEGTSQNRSLALTTLKRAAEAGDVLAESNLGIVYVRGIGGVPIDRKRGIYWLQRAAEKGYKRAQGFLDENGLN